MKRDIFVWVGEGNKRERVPAVLWIDEVPPECRRGKNRKMKNRRYKREKMEKLMEKLDNVRR